MFGIGLQLQLDPEKYIFLAIKTVDTKHLFHELSFTLLIFYDAAVFFIAHLEEYCSIHHFEGGIFKVLKD